MDIRAFWNRVRAKIKEKGVSQETAAKAAGLSYGRLRTWMSTNMIPPLSYAYRLARYLGVSLEYLINGKETAPAFHINNEILFLLKEISEKIMKIRSGAE